MMRKIEKDGDKKIRRRRDEQRRRNTNEREGRNIAWKLNVEMGLIMVTLERKG